MSVKKYVIEVGQKLLPSWETYAESDDAHEIMKLSEHLDANMKDVTFRWSKYRILLIDTTVLFEGGK